jgi:hypothetical protein
VTKVVGVFVRFVRYQLSDFAILTRDRDKQKYGNCHVGKGQTEKQVNVKSLGLHFNKRIVFLLDRWNDCTNT